MKFGSLELGITNQKLGMGLGFGQQLSWEMGFEQHLAGKGDLYPPSRPSMYCQMKASGSNLKIMFYWIFPF